MEMSEDSKEIEINTENFSRLPDVADVVGHGSGSDTGSDDKHSCETTLTHRLSRSLDIRHSQSDAPDESSYEVLTMSANDIEKQRMQQNYLFGFKKWKSHVTSRPLENRSEIVQKLYADVSEVKEIKEVSTLRPSNIVYALLFGWWLALIYCITGVIMFFTFVGRDYARFCFRFARYILWPFGRFVYMIHEELPIKISEPESGSGSYEDESTALIKTFRTKTSIATICHGFWRRPESYIWLLLGLPVLVIAHFIVMVITWLLVVSVPVAKINFKTIQQILYLPPKQVKIGDSLFMDLDPRKRKRQEILMYTHQSIYVYYYKYTVDGMNIILVNLLLFVVLSLAFGYSDPDNLHYSGFTKVILGIMAIVPLTYYIGMAIISISAQSSYAVGAVLNATFGTVVEMIISVVVLNKGHSSGNSCYVELVKSNLTGTIIGSILFIPGICMVVGGLKFRSQRFNHTSASISALMLFVAVTGVFAPTLFSKMFGDMQCGKCENTYVNRTHGMANNISYGLQCTGCVSVLSGLDGDMSLFNAHILPLVYACSILLPIGYVIGMVFSLKTHAAQINADFVQSTEGTHHQGHTHGSPQWSRLKSCIILLGSATLIALCAELITDNISAFFTTSGVSEYFIGVLIIAMVTELPEIINGIQFALQDNVNLGIEIGTSTAVQVCMIQVPILVLINLIHPFGLVMVFNDVHLYAVIFAVIVINYTFQDGKSDYFQGSALVIIYIVILCLYFYMPTPENARCE